MGKSAWSIVCVVAAVVMAAIAGVSAWLGGCPGMLELASGNSVPMKCHWAFVADTFVAAIGIVVAFVGMMCKDKMGRRAIAVSYIACAIVAACMPTSVAIGICAMPEMHCHTTALAVWVLAAIAAVVGIVQLVKSDPAAASMPKRQL